MLWKSACGYSNAVFYFVSDWNRVLCARLSSSALSRLEWSHHRDGHLANYRSTGTEKVFSRSTDWRNYRNKLNHEIITYRVQTFSSRPLPLPSRLLPTSGTCHMFCARGISSSVGDAELELEFVTEGADDEVEVRKKRRRSSLHSRYSLVDVRWAKAIVKKLKKYIDFQDENVLIVECNPELGLLTHALLMRTKVNVLCVHYRNRKLSQKLQTLMKKRSFKNRLYVERGHILDIRTMLKAIGKLNDGSTTNQAKQIKLLGTTFPQSNYSHFISLLSYDLGARNHIYSLGYIDAFLFVPTSELKVLGKKQGDKLFNQGSLRSALYKMFFNVKVLMQIPADAFEVTANGTHHYLIHLIPRPDIHDICSPQHIPRLILLLKELRKRRGQKIISAVQSFCSPAALPLKKQGFTEADNISDLTVEQVLKIYQVILTMPDCLPLDLHDVEVDSITLAEL